LAAGVLERSVSERRAFVSSNAQSCETDTGRLLFQEDLEMNKTITISAVLLFSVLVLAMTVTTRNVGAKKGRIQVQPFISQEEFKFVPGRLLIGFRPEITSDYARQIIAALGVRDAGEIPNLGVHVLELPYQASEAAYVQQFKARPEVEFVEFDKVMPTEDLEPNDPVYILSANSWGLHKINGPAAWAITTGNSNLVIAILDTGVDSTHEDLVLKMVPGWNIYNNNSDTRDINGHGTAVAGVAGASTNNAVGVASVAWECRIMPIRISDASGNASYSAMASGLTWAADHGARVANISYNATGSSTVSNAAKYFQSKGGVVAVAAGNNGSCVSTPDDPYLLTVGATDSNDNLYSWSNSGQNLDLVAPGNASGPMNGGGYVGSGGTSIASPFVAGAAALVLSANPSLTPNQVEQILKQSSVDLGAPGWDSTYGYGRLDLERAVMMSVGTIVLIDSTAPTIAISSPGQGNTVLSTVSVTESATDNVGVTKVQLYVDGALYASSTSAPFTIKWNTRKTARGPHYLRSRAYDAAGNIGTSDDVLVYK
jgi:subtilisin family serine protease